MGVTNPICNLYLRKSRFLKKRRYPRNYEKIITAKKIYVSRYLTEVAKSKVAVEHENFSKVVESITKARNENAAKLLTAKITNANDIVKKAKTDTECIEEINIKELIKCNDQEEIIDMIDNYKEKDINSKTVVKIKTRKK